MAFDLCFKCYGHKDELPPSHHFVQLSKNEIPHPVWVGDGGGENTQTVFEERNTAEVLKGFESGDSFEDGPVSVDGNDKDELNPIVGEQFDTENQCL